MTYFCLQVAHNIILTNFRLSGAACLFSNVMKSLIKTLQKRSDASREAVSSMSWPRCDVSEMLWWEELMGLLFLGVVLFELVLHSGLKWFMSLSSLPEALLNCFKCALMKYSEMLFRAREVFFPFLTTQHLYHDLKCWNLSNLKNP